MSVFVAVGKNKVEALLLLVSVFASGHFVRSCCKHCMHGVRVGHKYIKMYFQIKYLKPTLKTYQNKLRNTASKKIIKNKILHYCIFKILPNTSFPKAVF